MNPFATAPTPLRCVLIANRGEIAVRVMRTCRRLGVTTVAVFSEADRDALHVREADRSAFIGAGPATANYLDARTVIEAAIASGADAIHPGYGFLSENAGFAEACETAGIRFIGPSARAIEIMGSKIEAKRIAAELGIPTVPGFDGSNASVEDFAREAARIGYPVLIKASAGGGGRGMRRVDRPEAFASAHADAAQEAAAAFGDATLLLEKLIGSPRHIEVQLFGDTHGNLVHLYDRDCSVQRNNQKVLEEAPAPNLSPATRRKLHDHALRLGNAIGYHSAGTVEFILGTGSDEPYFLEMNTRLQVEHPVTEEVCGVDLVEWQLRVAAGLPLPLRQDEIRLKGHAIEARLAAEQPAEGFLPSIGTVLALTPPSHARFDSGIAAGSQIGTLYDSMLGKVISHGASRAAAREGLTTGLEELAVLGVRCNQRFLADCIAAPAFAEGMATTGFLEQTFPGGWRPDRLLLLEARAWAALAWSRTAQDSPWLRQDGFRVTGHGRPATLRLHVEDAFGAADLEFRIGRDGILAQCGEDRVRISSDPDIASLPAKAGAPALCRDGGAIAISHRGLGLTVLVARKARSHAASSAAAQGTGSLTAPLPGLVTGVLASVGQKLSAGDVVVTMEAMKLVHSLTAPFDGVVTRIHRAQGEVVPAKALILEMEEE